MAVSEMLERYKLKKIPIIGEYGIFWIIYNIIFGKLGLHQCQEIQQVGVSNQEKTNFWTCATCYEVGDTYELADAHLNSMDHIRNYMVMCRNDFERIDSKCAQKNKFRNEIAQKLFKKVLWRFKIS